MVYHDDHLNDDGGGGGGWCRYGKFRTLAMIKPQTSSLHYEQIKSIIVSHGFDITSELHQQLPPERAMEFYAEHEGKPFYEDLVNYMSSGPVIALALEREGAIRAWRNLMGPTNPIKGTILLLLPFPSRIGLLSATAISTTSTEFHCITHSKKIKLQNDCLLCVSSLHHQPKPSAPIVFEPCMPSMVPPMPSMAPIVWKVLRGSFSSGSLVPQLRPRVSPPASPATNSRKCPPT